MVPPFSTLNVPKLINLLEKLGKPNNIITKEFANQSRPENMDIARLDQRISRGFK